jgi:hypothetical protein
LASEILERLEYLLVIVMTSFLTHSIWLSSSRPIIN